MKESDDRRGKGRVQFLIAKFTEIALQNGVEPPQTSRTSHTSLTASKRTLISHDELSNDVVKDTPSYVKLSCAVSGYDNYRSKEDVESSNFRNNFPSNVVINGNEAQIPSTPEKDGRYFEEVLEKENNRINALMSQAEMDLSSQSLSEEIKGKLRSVVGKARLLTTKKFKQFADLCRKNMTQGDNVKFATTNQDLAGFWDLISIQIADVDSLFDEVEKLRKNNWRLEALNNSSLKPTNSIKPPSSAPTPRKNIIKDGTTTKNARKKSIDSARDIERRRQLLEAKKAMLRKKTNLQNGDLQIEFN
ncbi:DgyrCDS11028 [Dimorphilus gyrociliatus]|uniref:DgyrCDS11028 n=1 Tax=Dimorphilus gyrociliatus TaxID=2664684 RepID=A0A7I8W239_9ANNE|nr:DgyrCDS11028 [Dimorphilus gyrociliatus]